MIDYLLNRLGCLCIALTASLPAIAQIPADVELEEVYSTGSFSGLLGMVPPNDGTDRLFVVQQGGTVRVIENGTLLGTPFINLSGQITSGGEQGLLGLAFHPDHETNGLFYVNYTDPGGDTVVSEFQVSGDPNVADDTSERILMNITQDFTNHNGGNIAFGPDGYLYIGMGDGGSGGDPCNRAQTLDPDLIDTSGSCQDHPTVALLGKMLRVDVDATTPAGSNNLCAADPDGSAEYAVPGNNPFAADPDVCGEVWAYGLRNPWRWSFDRDTGDLLIGDVGQGTWEEVSFEASDSAGGLNFGWSVCEGDHPQGNSDPDSDCTLPDHTPPILEYRRTSPECSVTGGYRYRGPVSSLQGTYIFADYCSGKIWFATEDNPGDWSTDLFDELGFDLRSFAEDRQGRVYVLRSGGIQEITGNVELIFADGFEG